MPITPEGTPNPNALKFTVGRPVGGPKTFVAGREIDEPVAAALLDIDGVTSIFMTADFVTLSKQADVSWDDITPVALAVLEAHYS